MKRTVLRGLVAWFALLALFLLGNGMLAAWNIATITANERRVAGTLQVLGAIQDTLSSVQDAETGQRGYILTGRASYLEPYTQAAATVREQLTRLRRLTADNPDQQARVGELDQRVAAKLAELEQTITPRTREGFEAAQAGVPCSPRCAPRKNDCWPSARLLRRPARAEPLPHSPSQRSAQSRCWLPQQW